MKGGRENTCKEGKTRKGNWKGETRSIYLLNVFRAFVGGGGGGLNLSGWIRHGFVSAITKNLRGLIPDESIRLKCNPVSRSRWELEHDGGEDLAPLNNECLSPPLKFRINVLLMGGIFFFFFFFRDIDLMSYSLIFFILSLIFLRLD